MDKNTLSNYGWIVIAVLVLSVMIALATPFGSFIEQGVRATTEGLLSTSENAMNSAFGDLGVEVDKPTFEEGYKIPSGDEKKIKTMTVVINHERKTFQYEEGMTWEQWVNSKYNTDGGFFIDGIEVRHNIIGDICWEDEEGRDRYVNIHYLVDYSDFYY